MWICGFICSTLISCQSGTDKDSTFYCRGKMNRDSLQHGVWVCWKGDRLVSKERYRNGKLITRMRFNEKGELIETRDRKGRIKTYKPCGCH